MRKVLDKPILKKTIFNSTLFICLFLAAELGSASPFIHLALAPLLKIFLVWGFVLFLYQLLMNFKKFLNIYYALLFGFVVLYGITVLLNRDMNFSANIKALMYMLMIFAVVTNYDISANPQEVLKQAKAVILTFVSVSFVLALVSFGTFLLSMKGHGMYNGQWVYYGMFENRLWGLYNPNTGSAINTLSILMILGYWMFFKTKKVWLRIFFVINMLVHYFCLLLTNSRTALYTLILGIALLIFLCGQYYWLAQGKKAKLFRLVKQICLIAVCCLAVFVSVSPVREGLSYMPGVVKMAKVNLGLSDKKTEKPQKEDLTRLEEEENRPGGILTGRTELWKAGLETFKESPVFGITRENIPERVEKNLKDDYWLRDLQRGGLHNIFITVLVSSGSVGFIVFMAFIVLLSVKILRHIFSRRIVGEHGVTQVMITIIFVMLIMECLESRILYQVSVFYVLFWLMVGFALYFIDRAKKDADKR